jgi:CMP-N,N'-diacetyllegionaminic acid synthase
MNILGIIPARGGSKGIPKKNIRIISGKPLIAWTIDAALNSMNLSDVIVSTDSQEIAEIASHFGARIPFLRPSDLANDETPGVQAILHTLTMLPNYEAVVVLQPTSPLRSADDIDQCISLGLEKSANSVVSVTASASHPYWTYKLDGSMRIEYFLKPSKSCRRQDLPEAYTLNGAIYYAKSEWLIANKSLIGADTLGYVMPSDRSIDIDGELDWKIAEMLLKERS